MRETDHSTNTGVAARLTRRWATILPAILISLLLPGRSRGDGAVNGPVPQSLFGLHIHRAGTTTPWPPVGFGAWRLWDTYSGWPWIQPNPGEWRFDTLDRLIRLAEEHHVRVLLPLGLSPPWASSRPSEPSSYGLGYAAAPRRIEDWSRYVTAIVTRYRGRVEAYEVWNEPNLKGFYTGSVSRLLGMAEIAYRLVKDLDPEALVVSPSPSSLNQGVEWLDAYLQRGGAAFADVIGFHFYVGPGGPEAMVGLVERVRKVMARHGVSGKPLWNTETGWWIANRRTEVRAGGAGLRSRVLLEEEAAAFVARAYLLNWASGVERLYWYAWDNYSMGLTEADGRTLKAPARAYAEVRNWLLGTRVVDCGHEGAGAWTCSLVREGGARAWVLWHPAGTIDLDLPGEWQARSATDLEGRGYPLGDGSRVRVGPSPLLIERTPSRAGIPR